MNIRVIIAALAVSVGAVTAAPKKSKPGVPGIMKLYEGHTFEGIPYRLMEPIDLAQNPDKKYPLILSLHGAGGKGTDNAKNLRDWNSYLADESLRRKHPCFVIAPQSPGPWRLPGKRGEFTAEQLERLSPGWKKIMDRSKKRGPAPPGNLDTVFKLLDALAEEYNIDVDRVYVLGHSMGGFGSWTSLGSAPERFAAAIPCAGGLAPKYDPRTFAHVPIWAFHGDPDPVVPTSLSQEAFEAVKAAGGNIKYTQLKGVGHGASKIAFRYTADTPGKRFVTRYGSDACDKTADVWDWLFSKKRAQ
jgi:predicted peptidase